MNQQTFHFVLTPLKCCVAVYKLLALSGSRLLVLFCFHMNRYVDLRFSNFFPVIEIFDFM